MSNKLILYTSSDTEVQWNFRVASEGDFFYWIRIAEVGF